MPTMIDLAKNSVQAIHDTIAHVFTRKNAADLTAIQAAFHPDFQMVTITGQCVTLNTVLSMFTSKQGTRPTLRIEVSNIMVLAHHANTIWLQYQETHHEPSPMSRIACACIEVNNDQWQWRYLHETPIVK